jgi:hypothetical protein
MDGSMLAMLAMLALISAAALFVLWQIQKNLALQSKRQGNAYEELHQSLVSLIKAVEMSDDRRLEQLATLQKSLLALHELTQNSNTSEQLTLAKIHEAVKSGSVEQQQELQRLQEILKSSSAMQVEQLIAVYGNLTALKESLEESIKI